MAFLSLVTTVVDAANQRIDQPQDDGTYAPVVIRVGANLSATADPLGGQTAIQLDAVTAAPSSDTPLAVAATADPGTSLTVSKSDHVHNLSWGAVAAAAAAATSPLSVQSPWGVDADHVELGASPAGTGQVRATDGLLLAWDNSGTDRHALATSGPDLTVGPGAGAVAVDVGAAASFSVTDGGTPRILATHLATSIEKKIGLYSGAVTHAATKGDVGLDSTGRLTVWADGSEKTVLVTGDAGAASRLVALDSHDLICWTLDETASPFLNTGAGGACSLTAAGDVSPGLLSVFGSGAYLKNTSGTRLVSNNSTVGSSATVGTLHGWIKPLSFPAYSSGVIKIYDQIGQPWASPYMSIGVYLDSSTAGAFYAWVSVSGTAHYVHNTTDEWARCVANQWSHIAVVYDGINIKAYLNGTLLGMAAAAGVIDWGNGGPWNFGDVVNNPGGPQHAIFDEWRFRDVAMSASDVAATYRRGINWDP